MGKPQFHGGEPDVVAQRLLAATLDRDPVAVATVLAELGPEGVTEELIYERVHACASEAELALAYGNPPLCIGHYYDSRGWIFELLCELISTVPVAQEGPWQAIERALDAWLREDLTVEDALPFVEQPRLLRLVRVLDFTGSRDWDPIDSPETKGYIEALAGQPQLGCVEAIHLRWHHRTASDCVRTLVRSPHLGSLRELQIYGCVLSLEALAELCRSPQLEQLQRLTIANTSIGDAGAELLAGSATLFGLVDLDLRETGISERGALALARSEGLPWLQTLNLRDNPIAPDARKRLAAHARRGVRVV